MRQLDSRLAGSLRDEKRRRIKDKVPQIERKGERETTQGGRKGRGGGFIKERVREKGRASVWGGVVFIKRRQKGESEREGCELRGVSRR